MQKITVQQLTWTWCEISWPASKFERQKNNNKIRHFETIFYPKKIYSHIVSFSSFLPSASVHFCNNSFVYQKWNNRNIPILLLPFIPPLSQPLIPSNSCCCHCHCGHHHIQTPYSPLPYYSLCPTQTLWRIFIEYKKKNI